MEKHYELLGWQVKDKVTGLTGVVTHVGLDLFGCVQAIVQPKATIEKGGTQKVEDSRWFDTARLERVGRSRVMIPIPIKGEEKVAGAEAYKPVK